MLRGLARESRHWGEFLPVFEKALGASVVTLDLPGSGTRFREPSPFSITDMVESLRKEWLAQKHPPPQFLLGLSLGGMISIEWIARHPQDFTGAVLVNTSLPGVSAPHERMRPASLGRLLKSALSRESIDREKGIVSITSNRSDKLESTAKKWAGLHDESPVSTWNSVRQFYAAALWRPPQAAPEIPVLLLGSHADRLVSPRCTEALAERWGVPVDMHPTGGHELTLDEPEWVAEKTLHWLRSQNLIK